MMDDQLDTGLHHFEVILNFATNFETSWPVNGEHGFSGSSIARLVQVFLI
jgi:hypothetical protein